MAQIHILKSDIKSIKLLNVKGGISIADIRRLHDPDHVMNGWLYDTATMQSITYSKVDGVISGAYFSKQGIAIDTDSRLSFTEFDTKQPNFIGGSPTLLLDGKQYIDYGMTKSDYLHKYKHRRAVLGYNRDKVILTVTDGLYTIPELIPAIQGIGYTTAINLDGGGSCHLESKNRIYYNTLRKNVSWILFYTYKICKECGRRY